MRKISCIIILAMIAAVFCTCRGEVAVFEAEDLVANRSELTHNHLTSSRWDLWDQKARPWSGDGVLRAQASHPDTPGSKLHISIPCQEKKPYRITIRGGRYNGLRIDGGHFQATWDNSLVADNVFPENGRILLSIQNLFTEEGPVYVDTIKIELMDNAKPVKKYDLEPYCRWDGNSAGISRTPVSSQRKVNGFAARRIEERLDRGVNVVPGEKGGAYISWRLLRSDSPKTAFQVFRTRAGKRVLLTRQPVRTTCDWVDPDGRPGDVYSVHPFPGGLKGEAVFSGKPYRSLKLSMENIYVEYIGIGDLDGDGRYDFVVKYPSDSIDPWDRYWRHTDKRYRLEAFNADGKSLWIKDFDEGIEMGLWYSPFIVYDFDGDGRAEVVMKGGERTAEDEGRRVLHGAEYFIVLNGPDGKELARGEWPSRNGFENYNKVSRNQLAMGYLDGKTPCLIALRGTYGVMKAEAWTWDGSNLRNLWKFDNIGYPAKYKGQGSHSTICYDFDGDGRDEILLGGMMLNSNGTIRWSMGMGHNDHQFCSDILPDNPGVEIAYVYETSQSKNGFCVVEPATGKIIWGVSHPVGHGHFGYLIDMDPAIRGMEFSATDIWAPGADGRWLFQADGKVLKHGKDVPARRHGVFWDADLEKENCRNRISDFNGGLVGGGYSGWLVGTVDLYGDWREEIISSLPGEIRIYSTNIPAMDRRICLMQDSLYRNIVSGNSQGYRVEPTLSYVPAVENHNLSVILKKKGERSFEASVTVSASKYSGLKGVLEFKSPGRSFAPQEIQLSPNEHMQANFPLEGEMDPEQFCFASLKSSGGSLAARARLAPLPEPGFNAVSINACNLSGESGGKTNVVKGRPGAEKGCLTGWNQKGHKLVWRIQPPAGKYRLQLKIAAPFVARRSVQINQQKLGVFEFECTGGNGGAKDQWEVVDIEKDGKTVEFSANGKPIEISLTNIDNVMLNVADLYLVPVSREN